MTAPADLWRGNAARLHHGSCDDCPSLCTVARQTGARKFQCLECFTKRPTGSADLRKRVRAAVRAQAGTARLERQAA